MSDAWEKSDAWKKYAADFAGMSDRQIDAECDRCRDKIDEAEDWLEAVAAWEAAGKPLTAREISND